MRKPHHAVADPSLLGEEQLCRRLRLSYRSRYGAGYGAIAIAYSEMQESARCCQDCKLLLDIVEHYAPIRGSDGVVEADQRFTVYLEAKRGAENLAEPSLPRDNGLFGGW